MYVYVYVYVYVWVWCGCGVSGCATATSRVGVVGSHACVGRANDLSLYIPYMHTLSASFPRVTAFPRIGISTHAYV